MGPLLAAAVGVMVSKNLKMPDGTERIWSSDAALDWVAAWSHEAAKRMAGPQQMRPQQ